MPGLRTTFKKEAQQLGIVPFKYIEYGVYGDLSIIYPKPYSIYPRGTITFNLLATFGGIWGFPKIKGTFLGLPIIRTRVLWGLHWGPLILRNYHI